MELCMCMGTCQVRELPKASAYVIPKSAKFIKKNMKLFKTVPTDIAGVGILDIVDAVLCYYMPTFEQEIYDYYLDIGEPMRTLYNKKRRVEIDSDFLAILQILTWRN